MENQVIVVGAGAAGLMAAGTAARRGRRVLLLERNAAVGRKLNITGKGRCNVTNDTDVEGLLRNVPGNARFLFSAFSAFDARSAMSFFEALGVPLKTERGARVYPQSDRAYDITDALRRYALSSGAELRRERVLRVVCENGGVSAVVGEGGRYPCESVILATGGLSYPATGSTGDGYDIARALGHTVTPLAPSLSALTEGEGGFCAKMQGLSLKNIAITLFESGKKIYTDFGELLFTHFGLSGPVILSASAHMRNLGRKTYTVEIDLKPALDEEALDKRILRDFMKNQNRDFINSLDELLPQKMIPVIVQRSGIDPHVKVHSVTRAERVRLVGQIKRFPVAISGMRPVEEAVITAGGVSVREIEPKTMRSKRVSGLYFAGEIIDVDAYTGGFNLQIAWSTGYAAGNAV